MRKNIIAVASTVAVLCVAPALSMAEEQPAASQATNVQPVDFRKLKEAMPEKIGDLKRTENTGQRTKLGEMSISQSSTSYTADKENSDAPRLQIECIDYGNTGFAKTMSAWVSMDIDQESDTGYNKTTKVDGQPAQEQYEGENKQGTLTVLVGDRLLMTSTFNNVSKEQFQKLIKELPIKKLAEIKQ